MKSINRRIQKLESVAKLEALMRLHGNAMAKPTDPLQVLAWVIQHPLARLDLIANTANKLAQYEYARKRDMSISGLPSAEEYRQKSAEGRERVAQARRLLEHGKE
jgi:hypothetical protein